MSKAKSEQNETAIQPAEPVTPTITADEIEQQIAPETVTQMMATGEIEQQIAALSDQKSDEFIDALAAETRRKISEKLTNGAFVRAVFGGESGVNFTALPSFGGSQLPEPKAITAS